jgi:hypothetical protein
MEPEGAAGSLPAFPDGAEAEASPQELGSDEAALLAKVPADGTPISSRALRHALGWDVNRFDMVRDALVARRMLHQPPGVRSVQRVT